jgi:hypothetical protein
VAGVTIHDRPQGLVAFAVEAPPGQLRLRAATGWGSFLSKGIVMTVSELIEFLKTKPQDMKVAYQCYSEQCLLHAEQIRIETLCKPRPDGWIQNYRPDMEVENYLLLPGN